MVSFHKAIIMSLFVVVLSLLCVQKVSGHGSLVFPPTRNVKYPLSCHYCANGSGPCGEGDQWKGDPATVSLVDGPYKGDFTTLKTGAILEVELYISTPHMGHFVLELCRPTSDKITHECFNQRLMRDPTDVRYGPFMKAEPTLFFFSDGQCAKSEVRARFIVPSDYPECEHCILRWYWQTGNSCASHPFMQNTWDRKPSNEYTSWSMTKNGQTCHGGLINNNVCGVNCPNPSCTNERFANCADVKIIKGSGVSEEIRPPEESSNQVSNKISEKMISANVVVAPNSNEDASIGNRGVCGSPAPTCVSKFNQQMCNEFCARYCSVDRHYRKGWCQ